MTFKNTVLPMASIFSMFILALGASMASAQDKVDFIKDVKPIFEAHCIRCHGPVDPEAFRVDESEDALGYVEPGDPEESDLYLVLVSDDEDLLMPPPDENDPLSDSQINTIKLWVEQGADWPEGVSMVDTFVENDGEASTEDGGDKKEGDQAEVSEQTQRIFNAIGSIHPAAVHLPVGLLLCAGLFALFSLRGNFVMSDCAYYCLWLGTLGAIVACTTGWWFAPMEHHETVNEFGDLFDTKPEIFWHRTGALIVTAVAFLLALFAAGARNRDPDDGVMWKLGTIVLACGIGWVGHTGGEIHYPNDHYEDIEALYDGFMNPQTEKADPSTDKSTEGDLQVPDDGAGEEAGEQNDEIGKVSGEEL